MDEVADTARVTPLVVVPGDELDKVGVKLDTGVGVEDGGVGVANEIGRYDSIIGVAEDTLVLALGSLLDGLLDLVIGSRLLETNDEIDDGDVESRHTEGKSTNNSQSLI